MGTVLRVEVYGPEAEQVISEVFDEVRRLEQLLSRWNPHSDVSRVEQAPAGHPVKVSVDTIECVSAALQIARESGGAFDPTLVADGYLRIDVDRATGTITRQRDDLILDLGGIGKGYALDRAAEILRELGHSRALLDFGGQLLALDPPPGESSWLVGIHDPRVKESGANSLLRSIPLVGSSLATSATYEKGDHIIDPQQGQAAVVALSTTVLIPDATRADAFSTALAVLGPDHADPLLDRVPGAGALILVAGEKSARGYGKLSP
jgi:thiamine biosynthesis lipoprotein